MKMKNTSFVSIITVNYKQAEVTNQLLASLQQLTWPEIEIIVVDNNSGAESLDRINSYSNTRLIKNTQNLGFAGGNNVGIKASDGKYILLLNNDTEVDPGFIEPMIKLFEENPDCGAVSPKIKYFQNPDIIQYAGFTRMNPLTLRMKAIGNKQPDNGLYDQVEETNFAHGCAMMVPRKVINEVGLMPEEYFLYYEEHDWSTTIKRLGYKIFYQPLSVVYHKESVSVQKDSLLKTYFLNRNRILYMRRNHKMFYKVVATLYLLLISFPKNIFSYLVKREYSHMNSYFKAFIWNINN
jgi:GT2 family glycosyltransferase